MQQLEILDSRRVEVDDLNEIIRVFPTTRQVDEDNQKMTTILAKTTRLYKLHAVDISVESKTYGQKLKDVYVSNDPNKTGGIVKYLTIGIGSRVMLRRNFNVTHGLVNGAMGVIRAIEWPALRRDQLEPGELPQAVYIELDDKAIKNNVPGVGVRIEP
ncbi:unnamed protein product [Diatraea saccharalis]|uniref:DNA helicase Pif1-like 2B domain-containing protein n=1 Tax=Diatraea saccharalis TaxID=40085 RepID=A0A9N9R3Z6_9NEOP|nr:unnamed protein product [Diatraea saccharalis]